MVELTRRRFFFGLGAVAVMAAMPVVPGEAMIAAPPPLPYLHRKVREMTIWFEHSKTPPLAAPGSIEWGSWEEYA